MGRGDDVGNAKEAAGTGAAEWAGTWRAGTAGAAQPSGCQVRGATQGLRVATACQASAPGAEHTHSPTTWSPVRTCPAHQGSAMYELPSA